MDGKKLTEAFRTAEGWEVFASGQAEGRVTASAGKRVRLNYDFGEGKGFVALRKVVNWQLPDSYQFGFRVRGKGLANHLEFKMTDESGSNAWRWTGEGKAGDTDSRLYCLNERDLRYAWGPAGGGPAKDVGSIEWVVVAGPGGKGFVEITAQEFIDEALRPPFVSTSSSVAEGFAALGATIGDGWKSSLQDKQPWWMVDFGRKSRFGGLVFHWLKENESDGFDIDLSDDAMDWRRVFSARAIAGELTFAPLPGAEARHVRITFRGGQAALRWAEVKPDAFSATPNEFIHHAAGYFPRGCFPRYWYREQSYWTPIGAPWGGKRALINEEGLVEVDEGSFSLEPFVKADAGWLSWAGVRTNISMARSGVPMPRVSWQGEGWSVRVIPWMAGRETRQGLRVCYEVRPGKKLTRFAVAARPYQVNPPWQAFRNLGGVSHNHKVGGHVEGLLVDRWRLICDPVPEVSGGLTSASGGLPGFLLDHEKVPQMEVEDPAGLATGLMVWTIDPGQSVTRIFITVPYNENSAEGIHQPGREFSARMWRNVLEKVRWEMPRGAWSAVHTWRTAAGHMLINRDGAAIQPGPRRYTRSWVRDCVIMGSALAKAGRVKPLREFLTWYAGYQRADGFVPSVVDREGVDWLVEHDSHGQFLWGMREAWRFGAGKSMMVSLWEHIRLAAEYMVRLRAERTTASFQTGERSACFGLFPESASHEGYLSHPVHSYWDDFWGVRGLEAAAEMAELIGKKESAVRWREEATAFEKDVLKSLRQVIRERSLDYLPGSVEWADFDPAATANAVGMLDFARVLPAKQLHAMFAKYLADFRGNHGGDGQWKNYTAYEIRIIGAMVRLGMRDEANELLDFFLSDRRPCAWNQWPEISWREKHVPGHLGDLPHTWIAAEYVLAFAAMIADEREADDSLVLAAGVREEWANEGMEVKGLPTRWGTLDFTLRKTETSFVVTIAGSLEIPPGGLFLRPPLGRGERLESEAAMADGQSVEIAKVPCSITISIASTNRQRTKV